MRERLAMCGVVAVVSLAILHPLPFPLPFPLTLVIPLTLLSWIYLHSVSSVSSFLPPSIPHPRVLLVTAHPDDETMFFSPLLLNLSRCNVRVFILCLSTGDKYGEGMRRRAELFSAVPHLGVASSDVTLMDCSLLQDGCDWSVSLASNIIVHHSRTLDVHCIISFDDIGVSGHPNHLTCSMAVKCAKDELGENIQVFRLESPSLIRKYLGVWSLFVSLLSDSRLSTIVSSPSFIIQSWKAMSCHRSQLLWFRYLYMVNSSLLFVNSFTRVERRRERDMYDDSPYTRRHRTSTAL